LEYWGNNVVSKNQEKAFDVLWDNTTYKAINTYREGKYTEAAELAKLSIDIAKKVYGNDSTKVAISMNNLSLIYDAQGKFEEAESLSIKALGIWENNLGPDNPDVATSLNNLAGIYVIEG